MKAFAARAPAVKDDDALRKRELLRRRYRPAKVRLLFIGESAPASGRFFYRADSGLYRAMRQTFVAAFPSLKELDDARFLEAFRSLGCYLVDLCAEPVDRLAPRQRKAARIAAEPRLARSLKALQPEHAVTVMLAIAPNVERARAEAGLSLAQIVLPYPGRWKYHRIAFRRKLIPILKRVLVPILITE